MKNYVFLVQKMGWKEEKEFIWFSCDDYTLDEAWAEFERVEGETEKNGHIVPCKWYEYQGEKFYKVVYRGIYDEDDMPRYV